MFCRVFAHSKKFLKFLKDELSNKISRLFLDHFYISRCAFASKIRKLLAQAKD